MGKRKQGTSVKAGTKSGTVDERRRKPRGKKSPPPAAVSRPKEFGGPPGPEPTRYGDWQIKGRVSDF